MTSITDTINSQRAVDTDDINTVITRWQKTGNSADASRLYDYLGNTVSSAIQSYGKGDKGLRVPAYRIAFDAIKSYDPTKGADLRTHVFTRLQRLNRVEAQRSQIVKIPEGVSKDYSVIGTAIRDFVDSHNREPNDDELSDITGLSRKRIDRILGRSTPISGTQSTTDIGGDTVLNKGISEDTYIEYLYASSDPIDKKIIELTSGFRGRPVVSSKEAARQLRITAPAVSQRMIRLRKKMDELKSLL